MPQPANQNGQPAATGDAQQPASGSGFAAGAAPAASTPAPEANKGASAANEGAKPDAGANDPPVVPEAYRAEDGTLDPAKALERLTADETERAARLEKYGEVPEGDYTFSEIELETGEKLAVDPENEFLKGALEILKEVGVGQKGADELVGQYLKAFAADVPKIVESVRAAEQEKVTAEIDSLGPQKQARIDKVSSSIDALLSSDDAPAKGVGLKLLNEIRSRETFEIVERLLTALDPGGNRRQPGNQADPNAKADAVVDLYGSRGFTKGAA